MATKAKTSAAKPSDSKTGNAQPGAASGLAEVLDRVLHAFYAKHYKEAETLLVEALKDVPPESELPMVRRLRTTLAAVQRHHATEEDVKASPETEAVLMLNRQESEACVAFLGSPAVGKTLSPRLLYLKAAALAQLGQAEASAEALKKAMEGDPELRFLHLLDPDFSRVRTSAPFAGL